jgi:hypothetical protein
MQNGTVQTATALELGVALLQQFPKDLTQDDAMGWIKNKKQLGKRLRRVLIPSAQPSIMWYRVEVDYGQPLEDLVRAKGYDFENGFYSKDLTSHNFPSKRVGKTTEMIALIHFGYEMSSEEVIAEMIAMSLRPAKAQELFSLGVPRARAYCISHGNFQIMALGSRRQLKKEWFQTPKLDIVQSECCANCDAGDGWSGSCGFAALPFEPKFNGLD